MSTTKHCKQNINLYVSESDLTNDDSSFCSQILLTIIDVLQCHAFPFGKLLSKCPSLSVNGIFDDDIST